MISRWAKLVGRRSVGSQGTCHRSRGIWGGDLFESLAGGGGFLDSPKVGEFGVCVGAAGAAPSTGACGSICLISISWCLAFSGSGPGLRPTRFYKFG